MISVSTAQRLRDGGLRWDPAAGDRFVVTDREMDGDVFTLADMTVDIHEFSSGRVIGFNGTTEWALDSIEARHSLWLPSEAQLRERLGGAFVRLERADGDGGWMVTVEISGTRTTVTDADAAEAYGRALLFLVTGDVLGRVTV